MASKQVLLTGLKVADLKRELEERDLDAGGRKADLQQRLREALLEDGVDPDKFQFEIPDFNVVMKELEENSRKLEGKLEENSRKLEEKSEESSRNLMKELEENSRKLEEKLEEKSRKSEESSRKLEEKLEESSRKLEEKFEESSRLLEEKIKGHVAEEMGHLEIRMKTLEDEIENVKRQATTSTKQPEVTIVNRAAKTEADTTRVHMKAPQFDGKLSWNNYHRQFEAAARANGWTVAEKGLALTLALRGEATEILQTLNTQEQEDYDVLVKHLELRYGQTHLEHVYHSQLKNRAQKSHETLQEFEADVARLARLAYPTTPENVMERLAVQAFLDGLRDQDIRQSLILHRPDRLVDALAKALEFEAAKQSVKLPARVRTMEENDPAEENAVEAMLRRVIKEEVKG